MKISLKYESSWRNFQANRSWNNLLPESTLLEIPKNIHLSKKEDTRWQPRWQKQSERENKCVNIDYYFKNLFRRILTALNKYIVVCTTYVGVNYMATIAQRIGMVVQLNFSMVST